MRNQVMEQQELCSATIIKHNANDKLGWVKIILNMKVCHPNTPKVQIIVKYIFPVSLLCTYNISVSVSSEPLFHNKNLGADSL